jgi:hypothetical protein
MLTMHEQMRHWLALNLAGLVASLILILAFKAIVPGVLCALANGLLAAEKIRVLRKYR